MKEGSAIGLAVTALVVSAAAGADAWVTVVCAAAVAITAGVGVVGRYQRRQVQL